jgi:hypothetical protein
MTTHNSNKRRTSMPLTGFEPAVPASERPQTYALDRAGTGIAEFICCHLTRGFLFLYEKTKEKNVYATRRGHILVWNLILCVLCAIRSTNSMKTKLHSLLWDLQCSFLLSSVSILATSLRLCILG